MTYDAAWKLAEALARAGCLAMPIHETALVIVANTKRKSKTQERAK